MFIKNDNYSYKVIKKVAETKNYRLYLCVQQETGKECLLQIATDKSFNGTLDRAVYLLKELKKISVELEEEYAKIKEDPKVLLNYHLGFPEILDDFILHEQGDRKINILAFHKVKNINQMIPLTNITRKDFRRVDLRTSVWIMGKLLKNLLLAHSEGISPIASGNNIIIEPDQHYVVIFDWTQAKIYGTNENETVPKEQRGQDIANAAKAVITVLGGDPQTGHFPDEGNDTHFKLYTDFLFSLTQGKVSDTERAHARFYEIADSLWKRKFYPFTTLPL